MFYAFLMGCPIGMFTFLDKSKIGSWSLVSFMDLIYSKFVKGEGMDRLCWKPVKSWGFEVHGYYYSPSLIDGMLFLWEMVWCSKGPSRVAFFSWTATLGKILSMDNLWKKSMLILDRCCMCKKVGRLWITCSFIVL